MARRVTARPLPVWSGDLQVHERRLSNGLKALVLPRPKSPVVVCDLFYPVGSVDEPPGQTGVAHFVEHMLFKGTERVPKGQIDRLAFEAAGQSNAETSEDATHYWFAFPRERWELALAIEADRMQGALFEPREVEAERQVIAEERAHELDSPLGRLDQAHLTMSYLVHPYRNPILGWPDDLRRLTVGHLTEFYRAHYRPDGAVLVVVGDLEPSLAHERIKAHFGGLEPGGPRPPRAITEEPFQNGRRAFRLEEPDGVARGLLAWHTVPFEHPDSPVLGVVADLLACGRRSRLWDRLVERERIATWLDASQESARLAGQLTIQVEAAPRSDPDHIEAALLDELERLAAVGPTSAELARSRNRLEAAWRWEQEDLAGLASGLGHVALWGDWRRWQSEHRAALAVTADDVRRVASAYLVESGLTVGWSLPRVHRGLVVLGGVPIKAPAARSVHPALVLGTRSLDLEVPAGEPGQLDYQPRRTRLRNGLRLIIERRPETGTVALDLYVEAGQLREAKPGVAHLTGRMREEGTLRRSAESLAEAIEDIGGVLELSATGASLRARSEDLALAVELIAEVAREPAFPEASLSWVKRRIATEIKADREDPAACADALFCGAVYGSHPLGRDPRGAPGQLRQLTLEDVRAHNRRFFVPDNAFLVVVGDFEPRELRRLISEHFGDWPAGHVRLPKPAVPIASTRPRTRRVARPGEQCQVVIGHLGIARRDPDFAALAVLDHIFGSGPGFTDRLGRIIRDELGLAYSVGGGFCETADLVPGVFRVSLGASPDVVELAVRAVLDQVRAMHRGEFSAEEVERARRYLAGSWVFDYQTVSQRADRLVELERWGLPLEEPLQWPDRVGHVTLRDVRRAAKKHIHPESLVRVEYGPRQR